MIARAVARLREVRSRLPRPGGTETTASSLSLPALAGVALAGVALWWLRWLLEPTHVFGDTFWYVRMALHDAGATEPEATRRAASAMVAWLGGDPGAYVRGVAAIDPRYVAIFEARPFYPLVAALFVGPLGPAALIPASLAAGVVATVILFAVVFELTRSRLMGAVGVGALWALPSGSWMASLLADGWMMALVLATLAGSTAYLRSGRRGWLLATALALAALFLAKSANGMIVAGAIVLVSLTPLARHRGDGARWALAGTVAGVAVGYAMISSAVGAPGLIVSIQDLLTNHFARPDVGDPIGQLIAYDRRAAPYFLSWVPAWWIPLAALGLLPLALIHTRWSVVWLVAGAGSLLNVLVHPVGSEAPRLIAPIWVSAALGIALAVEASTRRRSATATPARAPIAAEQSGGPDAGGASPV